MTAADLARCLQDPARAKEIPPEQVPALLAQLAALQSALVARWMVVNGQVPGEDHLLSVEDAARMLAVSPDWLYRRAKTLPFTVRLGGRLRFSAQGLARYLCQRQGR